jgi:hypothetical protein
LLEFLPDAGVIFVSLVLQSIPFILIGVLASAAVEVYLPDSLVARWLPRRRLPVLIMGGLLGMVVPACDCGAIPVARRLVAKGVPLFGALAFILAAPVVNPIVIVTTGVAFQGDLAIVAMRVGTSFGIAVTIGFLASVILPESRERATEQLVAVPVAGHEERPRRTLGGLFGHATDDFLDVIPYFIVGALVAALIQTLVPRAFLTDLGADPNASILAAMPLGSILAICSQADAFVARSFAPTFTIGSLVAFMVVGQILDLRNGPLLLRSLGARYVVLIGVSSYTLVFLVTRLINAATGGGLWEYGS